MTLEKLINARKDAIVFTEEQKQALIKINNFLNSKDNFFLLSGYSGCGKTTIAQNIANATDAILLAPTNAAKNRIKEKVDNPYLTAKTLHSFYSIEVDIKSAGNSNDNAYKIKDQVLVIDECSMIEEFVLDLIVKHAVKRNCKVIFLGDSFQLEPVGKNPKIFEWEKLDYDEFKLENRYNLSEVKRYDGTLLNIATQLRNNLKPEIKYESNPEFKIVPKFSKQLAKDIKNNNNYAVLTSTNKKRVAYNYKIRAYRYLDNAISGYARKQDKLVSIANTHMYSNGETFIIQNPVLLEKFQIEFFEKEKVYDCFYYKDNGVSIILVPDLQEAGLSTFQIEKSELNGLITGLSDKAKKEFFKYKKDKYYNPKVYFNKNVCIATYGYAISCHKAQGQEWDNVYIDAEWLMPEWDPAKWFYTAITRAKQNVELTINKYFKWHT
jgi:ATP-dependent exoDNAse (exonuclease V) alpha subunit